MSHATWVGSSLPYLMPRAVDGPSDAWGAEAAARGGKGGQRIVEAGEVPADEEVADLLGVSEGETVIVRRRVMELDGVPCEVTDTYYPAGIARGTPLSRTGKIRGGASRSGGSARQAMGEGRPTSRCWTWSGRRLPPTRQRLSASASASAETDRRPSGPC